eukprot:TRINITY_DN8304_c0_g1_i2.p1 TRINITY_DN8304_c0_g1~~TRINITY_DN8304_c0_g1_i2.p1  ORF type:complete len:629 (+),score=158.72 TRINITY_DN8304_c0_g1_i2:3-1889(+)
MSTPLSTPFVSPPSAGSSHVVSFLDEDEDEDQQSQAREWQATRDSCIFLIDAHPDMLVPNAEGETPLQSSLRCAARFLTDKIISNENDLVAICFFGTGSSNNSHKFEHIFVFQELDVPDAHRIVTLENLAAGREPFKLGHSREPANFAHALWVCGSLFSSCAVKVGFKRIFILTNNDNPCATDLVRAQALTRAKDLAAVGADIDLFPLSRPAASPPFDYDNFFVDIVAAEEGAVVARPAGKFDDLMLSLRSKEFKKRTMSRLPFVLGEGVELGVGVYNLVMETKKAPFVWLSADKNTQLRGNTKLICRDTGHALLPNQIAYVYPYGDKLQVFERDEVMSLKNLFPPGLVLLGFKTRSALKIHHNYRHSCFLYPDDESVSGSTVLFIALHRKMVELEKVAVCRYTPRANAPPRLVALLPQEEETREDGTQLRPPGLHLIFLPFADDLRDIHIEHFRSAADNRAAISATKAMIKQLRIPHFSSEAVPNPALQQHYAGLQAMALGHAEAPQVEDLLQPDLARLAQPERRAAIDKVSAIVYPSGYDALRLTGAKRGREEAAEGDPEGAPAPKRLAAAPVGDGELRELVRSGQLARLTIPQLKEALERHHVHPSSKARKDDLVALAATHLADL